MLHLILILFALPQSALWNGTVPLNGHTYSLRCDGEDPATCDGSDHFEVVDESGGIQFSLSTPAR